jgi:pimeloyl-ACP methyl ester carboxylesterase
MHGNGGSIADFRHQIPFFETKYRVILADSRAQGKSKDPSDSLSYDMMSDDINALLDSLHIDSCNVIGWSDGGINALLLAVRHPDKVRKLAVTGANLWPDTTSVDPLVYRYMTGLYDSLRSNARTPDLKNQLKVFRLLALTPLTVGQLQRIKCPALIIGGDHDVILPRHTLLIAGAIDNSYLWILPGAGHSIPVDHSEEFNTVVNDFFDRPFKTIQGLDRFN